MAQPIDLPFDQNLEGYVSGSQISIIQEYTDKAGSGPRLHRHPYSETFIVRRGAALFTLADEKVVVSGGQVIVDIDATLVTAHSEKEGAQPTFKRTFGFTPMCAFVDHGEHGTGETLLTQLRPGKASPWSKTDHIAALETNIRTRVLY